MSRSVDLQSPQNLYFKSANPLNTDQNSQLQVQWGTYSSVSFFHIFDYSISSVIELVRVL